MDHPDQGLVHFVTSGFHFGFDIMYAGAVVPTFPRNLRSAHRHSSAVTQAISTEISRGHTSGPFLSPPFTITHCSPLGAVQKSPDSPEVRLILDLSQPRGSSINEGIMEEFVSVRYTSFDEAVEMVRAVGEWVYVGKNGWQTCFSPLSCLYG